MGIHIKHIKRTKIFFNRNPVSGFSVLQKMKIRVRCLWLLTIFLVDAYQIEPRDVCQSKTDPYGVITRAQPDGPAKMSTMGKYACSSYTDNSCCGEEESFNMYTRPIDRIEWWDFGACTFNPNKEPECNDISSICADYIQAYLSEIRCSPHLYPWQTNFPMSDALSGSRNTSIENYRIENLPICSDWCTNFYEACKYEHACLRLDLTRIPDSVLNANTFLTAMACGNGTTPGGTTGGCHIIKDQFTSAPAFCQNFIPDSVGETQSSVVVIQGNSADGNCINPSNVGENYDRFIEKASGTNTGDLRYREEDLLTYSHASCSWWFWWQIFLLVIAVFVICGVVAALVKCFCFKKEYGVTSDAQKDAEDTAGNHNQSYAMHDTVSQTAQDNEADD